MQIHYGRQFPVKSGLWALVMMASLQLLIWILAVPNRPLHCCCHHSRSPWNLQSIVASHSAYAKEPAPVKNHASNRLNTRAIMSASVLTTPTQPNPPRFKLSDVHCPRYPKRIGHVATHLHDNNTQTVAHHLRTPQMVDARQSRFHFKTVQSPLDISSATQHHTAQ